MRTNTAQIRQVRKEATVSGGLLRRDHPEGGVFFRYRFGYTIYYGL